MKYNLWQVREKDGSKVWIYAIREDCDVLDFIDTETQVLYNKKDDWEIKGYKDFPKIFKWDYTEGKKNKSY
jgi:hypothetical protein